MDNITFKSTIRPVSRSEFNSVVSRYGTKKFVDYPWTIKESILSDKVYTRGVEDCSFLGLTDGQKVLGMHLCPTMKENFDFSKIKNFIENKLDLNNPLLQGILVGGRRYSEDNVSFKLFDNLAKLLNQHNIPFTKLKDGRLENDVAYDSITDEWLISSPMAENPNIRKACTAESFFKEIFSDVIVSKEDEIKW